MITRGPASHAASDSYRCESNEYRGLPEKNVVAMLAGESAGPTSFRAEVFLIFVVCFPRQVDYVGVNCIGLFGAHFSFHDRIARWSAEAGHSIFAMAAGQHDLVPLPMRFRRHIAQIGYCSIFGPGSAAIGMRRVAIEANVLRIKTLARFDLLRAESLIRRPGDRRYARGDCGKNRGSSQFER